MGCRGQPVPAVLPNHRTSLSCSSQPSHVKPLNKSSSPSPRNSFGNLSPGSQEGWVTSDRGVPIWKEV